VDSALTNSDARALRERLDALHKPLLAVLITHGHPDHYNGLTALIEGHPDVPIYASASVLAVIESSDAAKEVQWKPTFGTEWPEQRTFPNKVVRDGERITLAGLAFTMHEVGPGESHADTYWLLDGTTPQVFLGDIVLHGEHAYVSDGHTSAWLANLAALRRELPETGVLHPGHGSAGGLELLDWQEEYLTRYREEVASLRGDSDKLSDEQKQELTQRMKTRYPDAGLEFLIANGADAVATELAASAQPSR
jgi:glyoxylase-like metal-dependent hydrolase (beta-lactamase superfamily II)